MTVIRNAGKPEMSQQALEKFTAVYLEILKTNKKKGATPCKTKQP